MEFIFKKDSGWTAAHCWFKHILLILLYTISIAQIIQQIS